MSMVHLPETALLRTQFATRFTTRQRKAVLISMQSHVDRKATARRKQIPFVKDISGLQTVIFIAVMRTCVTPAQSLLVMELSLQKQQAFYL